MKRPDSGSITAEFALLLPSAMLLIALAAGVQGAAQTKFRYAAAAAVAARSLARGDGDATAIRLATQLAGPDGRIAITRSQDLVRVRVSGDWRPPRPWPGTVGLAAEAAALTERAQR